MNGRSMIESIIQKVYFSFDYRLVEDGKCYTNFKFIRYDISKRVDDANKNQHILSYLYASHLTGIIQLYYHTSCPTCFY